MRRPMLLVALAVVPVYVAQELTTDAPVWVRASLAAARAMIHLAMLADVVVRTGLAPDRLRFLSSHKLDLAAVVVPPVRTLRELVTARSILLRPGLRRFTAFVLVAITACAALVHAAEQGHDDATIDSFGEATWWAAVTATTVGYGDRVPVTVEGRVIALFLMVLGIVLFAVLTAHVAAYFVGGDRRDVDAGSTLEDRLDRIETLLRSLERRLDDVPGLVGSTGGPTTDTPGRIP